MSNSICNDNHINLMLEDTDSEYFENDNRKIEILKCKYCGEDIAIRTIKKKITLKKPDLADKDYAGNCEHYCDSICSLDSKKCYLKEIHDSGLFFDCNKLF